MRNLEFKRNIVRNATNKLVEQNIAEIVSLLVENGFSHADIARYAGVSQTTVGSWLKTNRAHAAVVDHLIAEISAISTTKEEIASENNKSRYLQLMYHISKIQDLGFTVSLTPNNQSKLEDLKRL